MRTRAVLFTVFDGLQSLDLTGPIKVFAGANSWCAAHGREKAYEIRTASVDGSPVRTSAGLLITPGSGLDDAPCPDLLVVPGGEGTRSQPDVVDWLRHRAPDAGRLISVCSGAFLLAKAGLLDGRKATTHWWLCEALAGRFPEVQVDPDPIFVRDGELATPAGVTAGIDLALALVEEDLGREAALTVARFLVVFLRRPGDQAQFSAQLAGQTAQRKSLREVQRWVDDHPEADLSLPALAERANLSPRQFARAFTAEVGTPPGRYVDRVRLEAARRRLEDTDAGIEETARTSGFGTPEAMRRAFVRSLGVGPADYRRRFRPATTR